MTEEQRAVIRAAISSITQSAESLRACHTSFDSRDDWGDDHEAKADYDADVALVARLNALLSASIADTAGAKPVCWITREQLVKVEDESEDAWVYWAETGHVAEPDEVALYTQSPEEVRRAALEDAYAAAMSCDGALNNAGAVAMKIRALLAAPLAPSVADAAGASDMHIATVYEDNDGTKHVQLDVENFDDLPVGMKLYARYER